MLVFKFGGASVKDAEGVINLGNVVNNYIGNQILVVVSAMGKTTNELEKLTNAYFNGTDDLHEIFEGIKEYHYHIAHELFGENHPVFNDIANTFVEIDWMIEDEPHDDYDFIYDQIVSIGELVSTRIVNAWFNHKGITSKWLDVRGYIHTDNTYREGIVDWDKTRASIQKDIPALLNNSIVVTQGFLGGTSENFTTTLGREGSDYTASILASCLGAESVTTWKDVPGILNADPKFFADTIKFDELSYQEAIEMTYYGASVIHPKTIKPLQNANIPLLVKPFTHPDAPGTVIKADVISKFERPVIIVKQNQVLLSIFTNDYSFISESHLSEIFGVFADHHIKVNLMQTSALSFTACIDYAAERFDKLLLALKELFKVKYNSDLTLTTLRHYTDATLDELTAGRTVLMKQTNRNTAQVVLK
ncbi:aspartate kinase [Mucilaginibacter aquariorum]|uniref:Aspartokinase n=1 Tax=Mucilaginibacter aquariorum TaxID=2967225 RepID=A0ABT1SW57_9SPHI|nr:aspartate kinase [Mucilaginibacter aquariorum]MCQ6956579.1 aspartate kinase [Mucilaginibacter aquariorum]